MHRYIFKRILMLIPVMLGVLIVVFFISRYMRGDPARQLAGDNASAEDVAQLRTELGLDKPLPVQFGNYVYRLVTKFNLGISYQSKRDVGTEVAARFPTTMLLAFLSVLLALIIGIPFGIISAEKQYTVLDHVGLVISLAGVSMPNFWQGLINILIFSIYLGWLPATGFYTWKHWVLPALTVGTSSAALIMRTTRSSMLEVIHQDYIRTARAKGLSEQVVVIRHALKNALIPIITVVGIQFGGLLGGAVLTESIFAIPGLGKYMVDAIKARDYPVIQGGVLILALIFSVVNLIVDIIYAYVDPRIKSTYSSRRKKKKAPGAPAVSHFAEGGR